MKFAIITDIHNGPPDVGYKASSNGQLIQKKLTYLAKELVTEFVQAVNQRDDIDFVVNLGDLIEDVNDRSIDLKYFKQTLSFFNELKLPIHHLVGNHDVRTLSIEDIKSLLNYNNLQYSFDSSGIHFACLNFVMIGNHRVNLRDINAEMSLEQIQWLSNDLSNTSLPTIIFTHYSLSEDSMYGNFWFADDMTRAFLSNRKEIRNILENSKQVIAVFQGHQHWNKKHTINSIPYYTINSITDNIDLLGTPSKAWAIVTVEQDIVNVELQGKDRIDY